MKSSQSSSAARRSPRGWLLFALAAGCCLGGCSWRDGGLAPLPSIDPATNPIPPASPGLPTGPATDAAAPPAKPTPSAPPSVTPAKDAGTVDATPVTPPRSDAGASTPLSDAAPTTPLPSDAAAAVDSTPPAVVDSCAPGAGLLDSGLRLRFSRADDFAFDNEGRLLVFENRDIVRVGVSVRDSLTIARNVGGFQGGAFRVLPDGDLLVADASRDSLLRIDPNGQRPDRNEMSVRSPLKMAPEPGSPTTFFVTSQAGNIYRADTATSQVRSVAELEFRAGGLAVDSTRRKLYVGALGKALVVAYDIGPNGALSGRTTVAEAVPQPTALAVDSCGGVYIAGGDGGAIRRISLGGATTVVARLEARDVTTLELGSGKHGWSNTSLFALDTFGGDLHEIRIKR